MPAMLAEPPPKFWPEFLAYWICDFCGMDSGPLSWEGRSVALHEAQDALNAHRIDEHDGLLFSDKGVKVGETRYRPVFTDSNGKTQSVQLVGKQPARKKGRQRGRRDKD